MNGIPRPRRTTRRTLSILATIGLLSGVFAVAAGPATAAGPKTCWVKNTTLNTSYNGTTGSVLQDAIDAAGFDNTLQVRGRCVGNFRLTTKTLTLVGKAKDGYPVATLDGNGSGHVVLLDFCPPFVPCTTDITLTDLLITNGYFGGNTFNDVGGGIYNNHAILTLNGSTEVSGNHAAYGGGIASYGTVTMLDSARVVGNTATLDGGGVYDVGGLLTLNDAAQVTGNVAVGSGGGIYQFGGTLTLDGTSEVTGNTAGATGGGIYNFGTFHACATWTGAISPNTPDDPPTPTQVSC